MGDGTGHGLRIGVTSADPVQADLSTAVPSSTYTGTYRLTLTAN